MGFIVGLTGGIGSGKTAASDHFATLGIDVVDADIIARQVVEPGTEALSRIVEHFGKDILQADGTLDRAALRQRVFSQPDEKRWLEQLLHPLIGDATLHALAATKSPYALFVSPLLFESGMQAICNRTLLIDAPEQAQLERTMVRDNNPAGQVKAIMASQTSRETRQAKADDVICNDGSLQDLHHKVEAMHARYLTLAGAS
ncbi:MAG: dephospho-CoA kinase [Gammaproteobacteria bacterium]|nr:MAG: dephospho-CoA kinase [Gammaproteobacteria bacterium]